MANYNSLHTGQQIDAAITKVENPDSTPTASSSALVTSGGVKAALDLKAPLASPALTGNPTAPTQSVSDNSTKLATTAFVKTGLDGKVDKVAGKGLSANDFTNALKTKLDGIEAGSQVNTVTGVKGNSEGSYRTGNVNITKANIGLGNVDNTADTSKPVSTAQQAAIDAAKAEAIADADAKLAEKAPIDSPSLKGTPTTPTKSVADSSTAIANTKFVNSFVEQTDAMIAPKYSQTAYSRGSIVRKDKKLYKFINAARRQIYRTVDLEEYRDTNSKVYRAQYEWDLADVVRTTVAKELQRIPPAPTTNGTYNLRVTVNNGVETYTWVSI